MSSYQNCATKAVRIDSAAVDDLRMEVARKRLAESSDQKDALESLREIVGNFLGSEEVGLFRVDRQSTRGTVDVEPMWSFGMNSERYDLLQALGDEGLERVERGECHFASHTNGTPGAMPRTKAFVPLRVDGRTVAVLAILRLLPQKSCFDASDIDVLTLLSNEAGKAIFGSTSGAALGSTLKTETEKTK